MTIEKFLSLHEYEQEEVVQNHGVFLANFVTGNILCDVYQIRSFYVKFCYKLSYHGKAMITAFENPSDLPFLQDIDISGL